jgi:hypothetical protein
VHDKTAEATNANHALGLTASLKSEAEFFEEGAGPHRRGLGLLDLLTMSVRAKGTSSKRSLIGMPISIHLMRSEAP